MATIKISALAFIGTPIADDDFMPIVDKSDTTQGSTGSTKRIAISSLFQNVATNGFGGSYSLTVNNAQAAGTANGLTVVAGTNASDYVARFKTQAGTDKLVVRGDGAIGFNAAPPIAKPTVTGAKGGNAALTSLCAQLALLGLITDSTT